MILLKKRPLCQISLLISSKTLVSPVSNVARAEMALSDFSPYASPNDLLNLMSGADPRHLHGNGDNLAWQIRRASVAVTQRLI